MDNRILAAFDRASPELSADNPHFTYFSTVSKIIQIMLGKTVLRLYSSTYDHSISRRACQVFGPNSRQFYVDSLFLPL